VVRPDGAQRTSGQRGPGGEQAGWTIFSYLIAGMACYGGIGWLVGRWTHLAVLFPVGMLVGLALAILLIILRYGRS
jgi:ATP synthase protein I